MAVSLEHYELLQQLLALLSKEYQWWRRWKTREKTLLPLAIEQLRENEDAWAKDTLIWAAEYAKSQVEFKGSFTSLLWMKFFSTVAILVAILTLGMPVDILSTKVPSKSLPVLLGWGMTFSIIAFLVMYFFLSQEEKGIQLWETVSNACSIVAHGPPESDTDLEP